MAFQSAKRAFVLLDNVGGTPVDVSRFADNFDFPQQVAQLDVTTFGTVGAIEMIPGLADGGQISMSGPADVALGTFIAALKAAQVGGSAASTITYGPAGSVSGQIKQDAEVYVASFQVSTSVSGRVEYSASLQVTGAVTNGTW